MRAVRARRCRDLAALPRLALPAASSQRRRPASHTCFAFPQLLLLEKNRALESENTELKLQAQQALASVQELTVGAQGASRTHTPTARACRALMLPSASPTDKAPARRVHGAGAA